MQKRPSVAVVDPSRLPILNATGPTSVTSQGDIAIVTFTQIIPRIDGQSSGHNANELEATVLCKIAIRRENAADLAEALKNYKFVG